MKNFLLLTLTAGMAMNVQALDEGKIQVLKKGDNVYILDAYSKKHNLLRCVTINKRRNGQVNFGNSYLVPAQKPLSTRLLKSGKIIHGCGDDSTPWNLNGTYIGANHGCSDARVIDSPGHGLTGKDVGTVLTDAKGGKFYVVKIIGSRRFWVLGENKSSNGIWRFNRKIAGSTLKTADGRTIKFASAKMAQLLPACRIQYQKFLVNGKTPLPEGKVTECDFLDIDEGYDIIAPDSVLEYVKKNPGKKADFANKELDSVVSNKIRYRFLPYGACTVQHNSKANRDFKLGYMGFIQTAQLYYRSYDSQEYYIPKTVAFENKKRKFDFKSIQDYSGKMPTNNFMPRKKNISNPKNLPDRFIQFLLKDKKRKVGYAVGYSLIEGMTKPEIRAKNCNNALFLYRSKKSYPHAVDRKMGLIKSGTEFDVLAYRQYFNPELDEDATAVYFHPQGKSTVVYMHFHKNLENKKIKLPAAFTGKTVSVIEKTPSLKLLSKDKVPADGITVSVKDNYGYAVLKLD